MTCARVLFQCCTSAQLLVEHGCSDKVNIGKGLIVYIAFLNECPDSKLSKIADTICSVKLVANDDGILQSVVDYPCDLLIVPQYCLGGKLKGKCFQYHGALDKQKSETLYSSLVALCKSKLEESEKWSGSPTKFYYGTYGIRQILSTATSGPFFHFVDF
ncbi:ubiquitin-like protein 5 [Clonorchis sinensis]|uniref:D-aminoacyl-tRNA deacylase n=1 Tax=Clonorchis sinensis TaxID=79923 RepID=G7YAU5_CLOSI|nr:ubiquitin-like protein 5 [Clonorchis sinensis]